MDYPHINPHISKEELIDHFSLTQEERYFLPQIWRKEKNILGLAILLKTFVFLGFPPRKKEDIPTTIVLWISQQLDVNPAGYERYRWKSRLWDIHLAAIRDFTGFRPGNVDDFQKLVQWLVDEAKSHSTRSKMFAAAIQRCRLLHLELPMEKELQRLVNSAWQQYLNITCQKITERLAPETREKMDQCLNPEANENDRYEWMKANPGKFGMKSLLRDIKRLQFVNEFEIKSELHLRDVPDDVLKLLRERAVPEGAYQMKRHPTNFRYALLAALLHFRRMELTDNIIDIFLQLIHRIEKKADNKLERDLIRDIKTVFKKRELLYKMAKASTLDPHGTVEDVVFPVVGKEILYQIVEEFEGRELGYENTQAKEKKKRYTGSYRKMMRPVLDTLVFRTSNPTRRPLVDGIALVRKYLDKRHVCYPETEDIPEELLTGSWKEMVVEDDLGTPRIIKHYFELCVLQKLEKALKNKEVWVEGSYRYRNPDQDLPQGWTEKWANYCSKHRIPQRSEDFINPIRDELVSALEKANKFFSERKDVYIYHPGNGEKGLFRIPKIVRSPEHPILQEIKQKTMDRWGIIDLADILLEADRQVNFNRFFYSTAQRQVLTPHEIRERLLLSFLGRGTGMGLKRIHAAAKPSFSYEDLIYFNKRFVHLDSVREAIAALINRILEVRSPEVWENTTACTSDGKYLGAWEQNLVSQWNPHYQECGIMMYSMVDKNSAGIHAQVRRGTEVSAMITALLRHDTMMTVESNTIDSHGQSELGFAFCRFLFVELSPWLKRMKHERLYLPDANMKDSFPHLAGVLARPIRWDQAHEHYNDMVRHVVAAKERTAPVDSLLRRFNRNNPANQTYKGFLEIGKALKTIHDCKFLTDPSYRQRIHAERNVVESWNSAIDFICYGGKSEIQSNDPVIQELTVLCLHLLQNALVLVNTVMLERVLYNDGYIHKMQAADKNAMTPLFTSNVNPFGDIHMDINKPSFLEMH
jgi:TnpA family transposase